ncbi:MAG: hypothetical protein DHS20C11_12910 [Lysobacteraceae bacterium]|nr:MAG: hypothetical protein DHS20C11_12910 [Xanthomonadaceae bacterium]
MKLTAQQITELATGSAARRRAALLEMDPADARALLLATRTANAVSTSVRKWQWFGWIHALDPQRWLAPAAAAAMLVIAVTVANLQPTQAPAAQVEGVYADSLFNSDFNSDRIYGQSFDSSDDEIGFVGNFEGAG